MEHNLKDLFLRFPSGKPVKLPFSTAFTSLPGLDDVPFMESPIL